MTELAAYLSASANRGLFTTVLSSLHDGDAADFVPATQDLFDLAAELYADRPDKAWSLVDCTSFLIMQQEGLTDALSTDHHFTQAGFLKRTHAAQTGRRGNTHSARQLDIGDAPIALQFRENFPVNCVELRAHDVAPMHPTRRARWDARIVRRGPEAETAPAHCFGGLSATRTHPRVTNT
jgi:hypothetical protein